MVPSPCSITVAICTGGTMRSETVTCLVGALDMLREKGVASHLVIQIGGYVAHNRNRSVEQAKEDKSDYIMFIDNDMLFPPSGIVRLLDHDKDIVGVHYNARGVPGKTVYSTVKVAGVDGQPGDKNEIPAQLFTCYSVGTGFMLIRMSVFEKLKKPYFVAFEEENGEHHTEDVEFCHQAKLAGFETWCSPTIKMGHIGTYTY